MLKAQAAAGILEFGARSSLSEALECSQLPNGGSSENFDLPPTEHLNMSYSV